MVTLLFIHCIKAFCYAEIDVLLDMKEGPAPCVLYEGGGERLMFLCEGLA